MAVRWPARGAQRQRVRHIYRLLRRSVVPVSRMSVSRADWSLHRKGFIDQQRHNQKIKEAIKKNLHEIVSREDIILSDGKTVVKVPIRSLEEYKFRFDHNKRDGVGQGHGGSKVGDVLGRAGDQQGQGAGQAGSEPGYDYYEAEVNLEDLA